jgi:protease-4
MNVYKAGKYKDILSMFREHTKEEVLIIDSLLDDTYKRFIKDIVRGRNISKEKVEFAAEGKIFSGENAIKHHLVDAIGGRREAQKKLSELLEYDGLIPIYEDEETPFDRIIQMLGAKFSMVATSLPMHTEIYKAPVLLLMPSSLRF